MSTGAHNDSQNRQPTADQAAWWLLTLQSEELSATKRAQFIDWLRESPAHIAEMLRACRLQRDLARFRGWHRIAPLDRPADSRILRLLDGNEFTAPEPPPRHRWRIAAVVAVAIVALCTGGIATYLRAGRIILSTQLGERSETMLADGSLVDLAPDSEVVVRYRPRERLLELDRGEALFHVSHNPNRPFIVQAAFTRVRAVGTVFNVERGAEGVSVTVVEGRISVSQQPMTPSARSDPTASRPLWLDADEQVSISPAGRATAVRKVSGEQEVSWTTGRLVFDNTTVAEIVRRFNLYNRTQIRLLDADLAARHVSGVFQASDPESFVAFIRSVADVQVSRQDPDFITLTPPAGRHDDATP